MMRVWCLLVVGGLSSSCGFIAVDPVCEQARACDASLDETFGSFDEDDGQFGAQGTCWQNADTAKPCVTACQQFLDDELAEAEVRGDVDSIAACGGQVDAGGSG